MRGGRRDDVVASKEHNNIIHTPEAVLRRQSPIT